MTFADAASHFSMLTVGDGIVSQVPALTYFNSNRDYCNDDAASNGNLGTDITAQLFQFSKDALCYCWDDFTFRIIYTISMIF